VLAYCVIFFPNFFTVQQTEIKFDKIRETFVYEAPQLETTLRLQIAHYEFHRHLTIQFDVRFKYVFQGLLTTNLHRYSVEAIWPNQTLFYSALEYFGFSTKHSTTAAFTYNNVQHLSFNTQA
jgi:hypothetical protein